MGYSEFMQGRQAPSIDIPDQLWAKVENYKSHSLIDKLEMLERNEIYTVNKEMV